MTKKKLKVCLAMGGGVSLGSFSGAALTESLKLLLLFGKNKDGEPYEDVIVDGASGASAGAMALSIMVKCLMDYEGMIGILNKAAKSNFTKESLEADLTQKYGAIPEHKKEALIALEVAEKVQEQIWVKELDIEKLFGKTLNSNYQYNPDASFGLLDRDSLREIAQTYIVSGGQTVEQKKIRVLDKNRVVFACSITNASPLPYNVGQSTTSEIEKNAINSTGTFNHSELRVIDFVFDSGISNSLDNWIVFKPTSDAPKNPMHIPFSDSKSWAVLTATVMACGAFPIAFDPVILERYKKEYTGQGWPEAFDESKQTHNFAYVDGGTFNNEPIKEAFKIATFQDFQDDEKNFDRIILFVDPIVRKEKDKSLSIGSLSANKNELGKLTSSISSLVSILRNQGNVKEQSKIQEVLQNFSLKDDLALFYAKSPELHKSITSSFIGVVLEKIKGYVSKDSISLGPDAIFKYFNLKLMEINEKVEVQKANEIKSIPIETFKNKNIEDVLAPADVEEIKSLVTPMQIRAEVMNSKTLKELENILKGTGTDEEKLNKIYDLLLLKTAAEKRRFAQAIFLIFTEFTLNTLGKNPHAKRIPILPINSKNELIDLPGSDIEAFAGFSSEVSRKYAFEYGKYSALKTLSNENIREGQMPYLTLADVQGSLDVIEKNLTDTAFFGSSNYASDLGALSRFSIKRLLGLVSLDYFKVLLQSIGVTIIAGVAFFAGLFNVVKLILRKFLNFKLNKMVAGVSRIELTPVQISITRNSKLPQTLIIQTADGSKIKVKLKSPTKGRYVGNLHLSMAFPQLGLMGQKSIAKPSGIDPNLSPEEYKKKVEEALKGKRISSIEFRRRLAKNIKLKDPNINFNERDAKIMAYYLNPTLVYDFENGDQWRFIDNTTALYKSLIV